LGFSTSAAFILLLTAGLTIGLGFNSILNVYSTTIERAAEEQSNRIADEVYTNIVILSYSLPVNVTYDFSAGRRIDKWAAWNQSTSTNPPDSGPFIPGERDFSDNEYNGIAAPGGGQAITPISVNHYATNHFLFIISQNPETIFNLSVLWEGYGENDASYVYIWNYGASNWELIGVGASTVSNNVVFKDLTVNNANPSDYINRNGYLHLLALSYANTGNQNLHTDYARVFLSMGGLWVKNIGETTLDPTYAILFDDSNYIDPNKYLISVDGGYWNPGEVIRVTYNASMTSGHLLKITTGNGVSDSYYYIP
jgi:archaellum component FlaG (FlaF/FlaG flagellin family)